VCYVVHLSTTSTEDLGRLSSRLVQYKTPSPQDQAITGLLLYPNKWYIGTLSGCSCTLRHVMAHGLGFGKPEDWFPEDEESIQATLALIRTVRRLRQEGHATDCIDVWAGSTGEGILRLEVDLATLADEEFRLFENHHFLFD